MPPNNLAPSSPSEAQVSKTSGPKTNIWQRVLVHFLGLSLLIYLQPEGTQASFGAYIGTICLLPRGDCRKVPWLLALAFGLIQGGVAYFLTGSLGISILLAGFQSWLVRIFQQKLSLSWDWIVAPFLFFALEYVAESYSTLGLWGSVLVILAVSIICQIIYQKIRAEALHEEELKEDLQKLATLLKEPDFPKDLSAESQKILEQSQSLYTHLRGHIRDGFAALERIHLTVTEIQKYVLGNRPSKNSGWAHGLLKSQNWGKKGHKDANALEALLHDTSAFLTQELRKYRRVSAEESVLEEKWQNYEAMAANLLKKVGELPSDLSGYTESIAKTTFEIVKNMREDPADRSPGERFLDRYLTAVIKILDEYQRLSKGPKQQELDAALVRSAEVLGRMDAAFKDELLNLLQNDTINFTAEVDAIDAMLKMKGR